MPRSTKYACVIVCSVAVNACKNPLQQAFVPRLEVAVSAPVPGSGPIAGGTPVTLTVRLSLTEIFCIGELCGAWIDSVSVGGVRASWSETGIPSEVHTLRVLTPAGSQAGAVDVTVRAHADTVRASGTCSGCYTYTTAASAVQRSDH